MHTWTTVRKLRVLDFDTECRPLHYSEFRDESQITAVAWGWVGENRVDHEVLEQDLSNERAMLERFLEAYREADVVTGHYIVRHDLPLLNDHCMRFGWGLLGRKRAQDTKTLLPAVKGLGLSQENLGTLYQLDEKKHHMNGRRWATANTLTPEGREEARKRVVGDVRQHKRLRQALIDRGYLKPPVRWQP
jgi:DNA polymerase elongation subunit (family B)